MVGRMKYEMQNFCRMTQFWGNELKHQELGRGCISHRFSAMILLLGKQIVARCAIDLRVYLQKPAPPASRGFQSTS